MAGDLSVEAIYNQWVASSPSDAPPRAMAIANVSPLPPEMFSLLVRAAVYDLDLSGPRFFIDPCSRVFGAARTTNAIVGYLDRGTDFEKAGAASALYHALFRFMDPSPMESKETLGTASCRAIVALLRAILQDEDIYVVRAAATTLGPFRLGECSGELRDLADQVIAVGSEHADEYTRWCIRSWAGTRTADGPEYPPQPRPEGAGSGAR